MSETESEARLLPAVLVFLSLYVGFAGIYVLDQIVLRTLLLGHYIPDRVADVLMVMYWPLLKLIELIAFNS